MKCAQIARKDLVSGRAYSAQVWPKFRKTRGKWGCWAKPVQVPRGRWWCRQSEANRSLAKFPVMQGKYRDFVRIHPESVRRRAHKALNLLVLVAEFPAQRIGEQPRRNREEIRTIRVRGKPSPRRRVGFIAYGVAKTAGRAAASTCPAIAPS